MEAQATRAKAIMVGQDFLWLQKEGRKAAIDQCIETGELHLMCTQPNGYIQNWGKGDVPQPYTENYVRIALTKAAQE